MGGVLCGLPGSSKLYGALDGMGFSAHCHWRMCRSIVSPVTEARQTALACGIIRQCPSPRLPGLPPYAGTRDALHAFAAT